MCRVFQCICTVFLTHRPFQLYSSAWRIRLCSPNHQISQPDHETYNSPLKKLLFWIRFNRFHGLLNMFLIGLLTSKSFPWNYLETSRNPLKKLPMSQKPPKQSPRNTPKNIPKTYQKQPWLILLSKFSFRGVVSNLLIRFSNSRLKTKVHCI